MSGAPVVGAPPDRDLEVERTGEDRSERWLFVRQVAIMLVLLAWLVLHALLA